MKKTLALILSVLAVLSLLTACGSDSSETVAVKSVREISNAGSIALVSRYAGIVVPGETAEVKKDASQKILQVNVEEGDMVKKGDVLFSYDTEAMQLQLEKLRLEYEELQNKKASAEESIPSIQRKLRTASATDQLSYNLQLQTLEADILESTYNMSLKEREIASLEAAMENTDVTAPIAGRVMSVQELTNSTDPNSAPSGSGDMGSSGDAFITITDIGTFRIKGTINEMNAQTLREGMSVIIRSRYDSSVTWTGTLEKIDWENTVSNNNNNGYYMPAGDEMTTTTKYPFYVGLEDYSGLLLGQHIYIEPDYGQAAVKEGLWIPDYYLVREGSEPFVWAQNSRGKLEKRTVEAGQTDEESGTVQILSGLSPDDSIAFPEAGLHAGITCVPYEESMFVDPAEFPAEDMMAEEMGQVPEEETVPAEEEGTDEESLPAEDDAAPEEAPAEGSVG